LIGSTHNPTSTSEAHVPFATDIQPVHYAPYCPRSPVLLVASFASEERARRTRDCDFSSFPMSSYPTATSDPGIEPVLVSEPLVLGKYLYSRQAMPSPQSSGWSSEYVTATVFSADYPTDKGLVATRRGSQLNPHQYINNIYSARVLMHFLVAHGYETPPCFMSWIMQEPFFTSLRWKVFDRFIPTKPRRYCAHEVNRRAICTLSEFIYRVLRLDKNYQTFILSRAKALAFPLG
jgi:hypothetical protein